MKWSAFLLGLLLFYSSCSTKTTWDEQGIQIMFDQLFEAVQSNDFEQATHFVHSSYFTLVPKENMIQSMRDLVQVPKLKLSHKQAYPKKIYPIKEVKGVYYAKIDYEYLLYGEAGSHGFDTALRLAKEIFGDEEVSVVEEGKRLEIRRTAPLIAIGDPSIGTWKYVEQRGDIGQIIPSSILQ